MVESSENHNVYEVFVLYSIVRINTEHCSADPKIVIDV